MTHLEVIETHIMASSPCTLKGVYQWATGQGFGGSKMIQALHTLKIEHIITVEHEDSLGYVVELI